jgi:NADH-quinone oxidoreductase subunit M
MLFNTSIPAVILLCFCFSLFFFSVNEYILSKILIISTSIVLIHSAFALSNSCSIKYPLDFIFKIEQFFVMDGLSSLMYFLTSLIFALCFYYISFQQLNLRYWFIVLLSLEIVLILAVTTNNFFIFILLFEIVIIPMYIIVFLFGSRGRRVHAAYYFFFYTFASSIFLFIGLFNLYHSCNTFDYNCMSGENIANQTTLALLFFLGFCAKVPVYPVHIWLPEAHVESPTVGSVILAALLLKLGLYGLIRVVILVPEGCYNIRNLVWTIALVSMYFSCMSAIRSIDLKKIIAYSSIAHMNFSLATLFSCTNTGIYACYLTMFAHGFTSAGLFFCAGMLYDRLKTRNVLYISGQDLVHMRWFQRLLFFIVLTNMGAPFTCNFMGEIVSYIALGSCNWFYTSLTSICMLVLTSFYNLLLLYRVLYSKSVYFENIISTLGHKIEDLSFEEIICLSLLLVCSLVFGLNPDSISPIFDSNLIGQ